MSFAVLLIVAVALAACGSDSGTGTAAPEPPRDRFYRTFATYNSVLITNFHLQGETRGLEPACSNTTCQTRVPHPIFGFTPAVQGPFAARELESAFWSPEREVGGVWIWELDYDPGFTDYGAWLDHSFFQVVTAPAREHVTMLGEAFGRIYPDSPLPVEGSATYAGGMVGLDVITAAAYTGAAQLEVDFADASLDATFSDIADVATGERIADIMFPRVPIFRDFHTAQAFERPSVPGTNAYINARFYGPDNEEVSGVFGKDTLIGAFGTRRQ